MTFEIHAEPRDTWGGESAGEYARQFHFSPAQLNQHWLDTFGTTRTGIVKRFFPENRDLRILEIGCNCGNQLELLRSLGYEQVYGLEIGREARKMAVDRGFDVQLADASEPLHLPNRYLDVVYSCACLSHIPPDRVQLTVNEMRRISAGPVILTEYYAFPMENFCWLHDYPGLFGAHPADTWLTPKGGLVTYRFE